MNFITHIKSNPSIDDVLKALMSEAQKGSQSDVIQQLVANHPYNGSIDWFEKLFEFIDGQVTYQLDENGKEQLRTPENTLRNRIGDCDDFSILWSSILTAVGIKHAVKIVDYHEDSNTDAGYDHVYVIVPIKGKQYITLDSVIRKFNVEVPHNQSRLYIKK